MPVTATFQADFSRWDRDFAEAKKNLVGFEVSAKGVQAQLQRLAQGFSGANIIRDAQKAAAAVESIGGAARLTANEQRRVNATVTEAIAKYKALGQSAPADLKRLQKETAGVNTAMASIGGTLLKLGGLFAATFTVGALTRAARSVIELGGTLTDLSARTGISTKALQEFRFAGGQVGVSLESITTAVGQMQKRLVEGEKSTAAALKDLGLSFTDLRNLRPEDQFATIADKINDIEDPAKRAQVAMALMGRGALEVMPLLVSEFDQLRQKANDLGVVLDDETIRALDEMGDTLDALMLVGQAVVANVLKPMGPHLKDLANFALSAAGSMKGLSSVLDFLGNTFLSTIMIVYRANAAFADLEVALLRFNRATNPFAAALGTLDQAIADATARAQEYRDTANLLTQDLEAQISQGLKPQAQAIRETARAFKPLSEAEEEAARRAEEAARAAAAAAKAIKNLRDEISGAKTLASIKQMAAAWNGLTASQKASAPTIAALAKFYDALPADLMKIPPSLIDIMSAAEEASRAVGNLKDEYTAIREEVSKLDAVLDKLELAADAEEARTVLADIAADMAQVGNRIEEAFDLREQLDETIADIFGVDNAIQEMFENAEQEVRSFGQEFKVGIQKIALDLPSIISGAISGDLQGEELGEALGTSIGASMGGAIGQALGGQFGGQLGQQIGAMLGQLVDAIFSSRAEQTARRVAREFGVAITEELGQAIVDTAENMFDGNQVAAQIFHLDDIIQAAGGINLDNVLQIGERLRDIFVMVETGAFTAAQGMEVLDRSFKQYADFVTRDGALASEALLELIDLNERFGTSSAAIADFVRTNTETALGGLTTFLENASVSSQESAAAIGSAIAGIAASLQQTGATPLEALEQIGPLVERLQAQLAATGFSGGAAFAQIRADVALARDEIAGPMLNAAAGLGQTLLGLHNARILDPTQFSGIAAQITDLRSQLLAMGKDGDQVNRLIAPGLQVVWELQRDFGYAVDAATQAMLDEAEAAGVVGDQHRSAQQQMQIALERTADAVEFLAETFGYVADAADTAADAVVDDFDRISDSARESLRRIPRDINIDVNYRGGKPPGADVVPLSTGGPVQYAAQGLFVSRGADNIAAMLQKGEFVHPVEAVQHYGVNRMKDVQQGRATIISPSSGMVGGWTGPMLTPASSVTYPSDLPARQTSSTGQTIIVAAAVVGEGVQATDADVDKLLAALVKGAPQLRGNVGGVRTACREAFGIH